MSSSRSLGTIPGDQAEGVAPAAIVADEPEILARERTILRSLLELVAEREAGEATIEETRARAEANAADEYHKARIALAESTAARELDNQEADKDRRRAIVDTAIQGEAQAKAEFGAGSRKIAAEFDMLRETAKAAYQKAKTEAEAAHDLAQKQAGREDAETRRPIANAMRVAEGYRQRLAAVATRYARFGLDPEPPRPSRETYTMADPIRELLQHLNRMEKPLGLLEGLIIPKIMTGAGQIGLLGLLIGGLVGLAALAGAGTTILGVAAVAGVILAFVLRRTLLGLSKAQLEREYAPLMQALADADALAAYCRAQAQARYEQARREATERRDEALRLAKEAHARAIAEGEARRDERLRKINEVYALRMVDVQTTQQRDLRDAIEAHERRENERRARAEDQARKLDERYQALQTRIRDKHQAAWQALAERWRTGVREVAGGLEAIRAEVDALGPPWEDSSWNDRRPPEAIPPVLRFGTVPVDLTAIPGGIARDPRLMEGLPTRFDFPALRAFPAAANVLVEAPAEARGAALAVLQAAMFRLLTSLPPGRVRFTIVDPAGIGRDFGAFMHLADHDPALVTNQVWTDPRQIDERLAELAAHMEMVAQKYLRNEYATIEDYNRVAGEVAEPYRVLVVADFPGKFDEKSATRLAAIAAGGVPCGVLTLIAADPARPTPLGVTIDDLRPHALRLAWAPETRTFAWEDPDLSRFPLDIEPPPPPAFATRQIQKVGALAKETRRVVVPFEFIAPPPESWWTRDSRKGLDVPLGKAGATKRRHLTLGEGTSQHVLIAGRTGSGKSTLMHALITNLALSYSPDEVEMYLVDFKKGVEFKVYATHALPHASVVAIESEREFGLSVLQRIDAELKARADRFREAGVQDLAGYRDAPGTPPLPRIVLIVDEFQEFFVEEDKLAQEAALLLDRLVRQGRAFGVHVLLGSQSLGGAFTLARSTLGQMAVRIALQCSEADSQLILSEQNLAARLLARPGEAIYNDANGATEGNHHFQVVWLSDDRREAYLKQIHILTDQRRPVLARTPIVFEGDAPAELDHNPLLRRRLEAGGWPESPRSALAWLGDPVAIKDPTAALFRRQGGNHLLIIGQNEEAARGVTAAALCSLAAQFPPATDDTIRYGARFFLLDGTPEDHPEAEALARLAGRLPHGVTVGGLRDSARLLEQLGRELRRRQGPEGGEGPETFLFIHDLARFRDLRRPEDDFSFSRREEPAGPFDHLDALLREGPIHGLHVVTWCDTVGNLNRVATHQLLREFGLRVLFQMSPNDSGQLLDAPHAARLGAHRALLAGEEENRLEKFRPYRVPDDAWLDGFVAKLRGWTAPGGRA